MPLGYDLANHKLHAAECAQRCSRHVFSLDSRRTKCSFVGLAGEKSDTSSLALLFHTFLLSPLAVNKLSPASGLMYRRRFQLSRHLLARNAHVLKL